MQNRVANDFDELVADYYRIWFRYHPLAAVYASVPGYEGLLTADGDDEIGALSNLLSNLLVSLKELDFDALDSDRQLDLHLIYGAALIEHRFLMEQDWRYRDPARYLPLQQLQELVIRQPERLCDALMSVMARTPNYLRVARSRLTEMPNLVSPIWLADALKTLEEGIPWLKRLGRDMPQTRECCADQGRFHALSSQAAEALEDFHHQLAKDLSRHASGVAHCGEVLLNWILRHRDQLNIHVEQALRYARNRLKRIHAEGGADVINQGLGGERLSGSSRIQAYREEAQKLKAFLHKHQLLPIVSQPLEFLVTKCCFKQPDCGNYLRSEKGGIFLIPHDQQVRGGESRSEIKMRHLYNGWAGYHYLAWTGGVPAHSLVRQINASAAFLRGWAHYVSRTLETLGYFDEDDLVLLRQRRLILVEQACLDLEFHLGMITHSQALERLKSLSNIPCWAEFCLTTLSRQPTDAFMALLGADLIEHLRCQMQQQYPTRPLKILHEELLVHGPVALPLVVCRACGQEIWEGIMKELFDHETPN
jgi:hypothetical protein